MVILKIIKVKKGAIKKKKTFGDYYFYYYPFNSVQMLTFEIIYNITVYFAQQIL